MHPLAALEATNWRLNPMWKMRHHRYWLKKERKPRRKARAPHGKAKKTLAEYMAGRAALGYAH